MDLTGPKMRVELVQYHLFGVEIETPPVLHQGQFIRIGRNKDAVFGEIYPTIFVSPHTMCDLMKVGDTVWFDDGKITTTVKAIEPDNILLEIVNAPRKGFKLTKGKSLNLPVNDISLPIFSQQDKENLPFILSNADIIGLSYIQAPVEIAKVQEEIKRSKRDIGIILKIETKSSFDNLPFLLLQAMQSPKTGIMIARGDLAIELGLLRMAEVQEEIMWIAEAAHIPVIWATQVLDRQIKKGFPTRAEISDVVKATRAECVLLNKGPHIIDAIKTFENIDRRMAAHEYKMHKTLRELNLAKSFVKTNHFQ
jgi:pyruvate kinase